MLNNGFWKRLKELVELCWPIVELLREADSGHPMVGQVLRCQELQEGSLDTPRIACIFACNGFASDAETEYAYKGGQVTFRISLKVQLSQLFRVYRTTQQIVNLIATNIESAADFIG